MNDTLILLASIVISTLVGAFVGFTFSKYKKEKVVQNLKQEFRN